MELTVRQLEIIKAACNRIDEHGIQELTTKNLAADLGVSEAALYRHFKSKNEILIALMDFFFDQLKPDVERVLAEKVSPVQRVKDFMMVPFHLFGENPAVVSVIFSDGIFQFDQQLREKIQEIIQFNQKSLLSLLLEGQATGEIRNDIPPFQLAPMVMGSMRFTVMRWKLDRKNHDLNTEGCAACDAVEKLIRNPFYSPESKN